MEADRRALSAEDLYSERSDRKRASSVRRCCRRGPACRSGRFLPAASQSRRTAFLLTAAAGLFSLHTPDIPPVRSLLQLKATKQGLFPGSLLRHRLCLGPSLGFFSSPPLYFGAFLPPDSFSVAHSGSLLLTWSIITLPITKPRPAGCRPTWSRRTTGTGTCCWIRPGRSSRGR